MKEVLYAPLFNIVLCMAAFQIGNWVYKRTQFPLFNPVLIAIGVVMMMIRSLAIPLDVFKEGTAIINLLLGPATVVLALPMYRQRHQLRKHILPILVATGAGTIASMLSIIGLSRLLGLDTQMMYSLLPKSVTTPIAMEVSGQLGGIVGITVTAVIITGIAGAVIGPNVLRLVRIKHPIAVGVAMGTASHAVGTSKAVQLGEVQGAMSGIAIGIAGIFTVLISALGIL